MINVCRIIQCPYYANRDSGCQYYTTAIDCHLVGVNTEAHRVNLIQEKDKFFLKMNPDDYPLDSLQEENDSFFVNNECYKADLLLKKNGLNLETPNRIIERNEPNSSTVTTA